MKKIIVITLALAVIIAVLFTTCEFNFDKRPEAGAGSLVAVENITGIPAQSQPYIVTPLSGTVLPQDATNKKIEWSVKNAGGTGAVLNERGTGFSTEAEGTVTVSALIKNGLGDGIDYTQDFVIRIALLELFAVREILGLPTDLTKGVYTLNGRVSPRNAVYQDIVYSVKDGGSTNASVSGNVLTVPEGGTVVITAAVVNGLLDSNFTQDFSIFVYRTVTVSGTYNWGTAVYWTDGGASYNLPLPSGSTWSQTSGIVYANGKLYIAGYYGTGYSNPRTPCYWISDGAGNDTQPKTLPLTSATITTETFAIAADSNYVYITGREGPTSYRYWKIDVTNTEAAPTMTPLNTPPLTNPPPGTSARLTTVNRFALLKNGRMYIPFHANHDAYYWNESGQYHRITEIASPARMYAAAFVGNDVYFTGTHNSNSEDYLGETPESAFYVALKGGVFEYKSLKLDGDYSSSCIMVLEQNGSPVFYGYANTGTFDGRGYCYWDTAGNRTMMRDLLSGFYDTSIAVFDDGELYVGTGRGGYLIIGRKAVLLSGDPYLNDMTGLVVR